MIQDFKNDMLKTYLVNDYNFVHYLKKSWKQVNEQHMKKSTKYFVKDPCTIKKILKKECTNIWKSLTNYSVMVLNWH